MMRRALLPVFALALAPAPVFANPEGGTVTAGEAAISGEGTARVLITQTSERALIDWQRFSIGAGETTRFVQPGAHALAANRVVGADPSEIFGTLEANGRVVLINRNGVLFGRSARVDTAGLVATVHDLDTPPFLTGRTLRFDVPGAEGATVINEGTITVRDTGLAALVAPRVRNRGTIRAGLVELAAARGFAVDLYGDGLLHFAPSDALAASPGDGALVESAGRIEADGGEVNLSAHAAEAIVNASVNVDGVVQARRISQSGGVIRLEGPGEVRLASEARLDASGSIGGGEVRIEAGHLVNEGAVLAEGGVGAGGSIHIAGARVVLGGRLSATGASGGEVAVEAAGLLSLGERVEARGTVGAGGVARYAAGSIMESAGSLTDVSGATDGGRIAVDAGQYASSGMYRASGHLGRGGFIDLRAADLRALSVSLDATGGQSGGLVRVGGAFRGGETPDRGAPWYDLMVGRWGELPPLVSARETFVNDGTAIDVSSSGGVGGTAVVWSQERTTFLGAVDARGPGGGGAVALSSAQELRHASLAGVEVGNGHLVVDAGTLTVGGPEEAQGWSYAGVLGVARTLSGTTEIDVGPLNSFDEFGASVSLNASGSRLAVGAPGHRGSTGNLGATSSGAVFLFTFTDDAFSGGRLMAVVGKGYTGGRNVDVGALTAHDHFGASVSLNASGTRLAVGAPNDGGADNRTDETGAVYLYTFTDDAFSGGQLAAVVGRGYTGGRNVDVSALEGEGDSLRSVDGDHFGASVSLNASGARLAVGAPNDDGAGNQANDAGAVYLFTFTDDAFSGGRLAAVVGEGYTGGRNVDVPALSFGASVSLNASGTRLAVGTHHYLFGAVYLFTFTDDAFSGGRPALVVGPSAFDYFGASVSLNASGTRLAVGAPDDNGAGSQADESGAVYLYTFTDDAFSGGRLAAVVGKGYTGGENVDVGALEAGDHFGASVSLNASGTRLAVGARWDDGAGNQAVESGAVYHSGAVYLYTFTDDAFSGGRLAVVVGKGYTGERNVDVGALEGGLPIEFDEDGRPVNYPLTLGDEFGASVSLNASGTRLAVGAPNDNGAGNRAFNSGAVYLYTFTDDAFSGGRLAAVVGKGYTGGRNVDVGALEEDDGFGASVSLNASGTRLAVGAPNDDGAGNQAVNSGAVYLYTFTDDAFSGGQLAAVVGDGYTGERNVDVGALEGGLPMEFDEDGRPVNYPLTLGDEFGASVSLNASGTRLAVGAPNDNGAGNRAFNSGAVYLYTFTDDSFSGGRLAAVVGKGYTGERNVDAGALEAGDIVALSWYESDWLGDHFGASVSLNESGTRLAVGAPNDDGAGNQAVNSGAVYLYTFTDDAFSGGRLAAVVGKGYTGERNVDVVALEGDSLGGVADMVYKLPGDHFGASVSLNASGTRLAVGVEYASAVYLFTFIDDVFSGGRLAGEVGLSPFYIWGRNVIVHADGGDRLGASVSLNASGTRLVVGAPHDDGAGNQTANSGTVYLFTFTDDTFWGGRLEGIVGLGYRRVIRMATEADEADFRRLSLRDIIGLE